jgi:hypothetical protein
MSTETPGKSRLLLYVVIVVVVLIGAVGVYYLYQNSQQPNIQATAINIVSPLQSPASSNVVDQGRVSGKGSFSYTASLNGDYYLTFDNSFSFFAPKYVSVNYSVAGKQYTTAVSLSPGETKNVNVGLDAGGQVSGSFNASGGSGNDVNFRIVGNTCSESVAFSFSLVNAGSANGFADVAFTVDGSSAWSNRYFVSMNSSVPVSGSVTLNDCGAHTFKVVVTNQQKP